MYYPFTVPNEIIYFIKEQFDRFQAPVPSDKALDKVSDFILNYIAKSNYYPTCGGQEAQHRYENPGMTEPEKIAMLGKLEYELKIDMREGISFEQLHLAAWSAMLFCWSDEGEQHVEWFRRMVS